jgi:hypothetical protein
MTSMEERQGHIEWHKLSYWRNTISWVTWRRWRKGEGTSTWKDEINYSCWQTCGTLNRDCSSGMLNRDCGSFVMLNRDCGSFVMLNRDCGSFVMLNRDCGSFVSAESGLFLMWTSPPKPNLVTVLVLSLEHATGISGRNLVSNTYMYTLNTNDLAAQRTSSVYPVNI